MNYLIQDAFEMQKC